MTRVTSVTVVKLSLQKSMPPKVDVEAKGIAPVDGGSNARLVPFIYVQPPTDGILDLDFVFDAPERGITKLTPITAEKLTLDGDPANFWGKGRPLIGVRVHASTNKMTRRLVQYFSGNPVPWPWQALGGDVETTAEALVGRILRVYKTGDVLTDDFVEDRVNIEVDPKTGKIVDVWLG